MTPVLNNIISSKTLKIILIQLFPLLTATLTSYFGILDFAELKSFDKRAQLLGQKKVENPSELTLVNIDQKSESALGPWPWPHGAYFSLLGSIMPYDPKCVGILIWFDREGTEFHPPDFKLEKSLFLIRPYDSPSYRNKNTILEVSSWRSLPKEFEKLAADSSFTSTVISQEDGIYRQMQLVVKDKNEGKYRYSLELLLICKYLGVNPSNIELSKGLWFGNSLKLKGDNRREINIPIDQAGRMLITFYKLDGFSTVSFVDVLDSSQNNSSEIDLKNLFEDKIVLVGNSGDSTTSIPTSYGFQKALFIRASAVKTILSQNFINRGSKITNLIYVALLCLISTLVAIHISRKWQKEIISSQPVSLIGRVFSRYKGVVLGNALILSFHLLFTFYLFYAYQVWVDMVNPALGVISSGICAILSLGYINLQAAQRQLVQSEREAAFGVMSAQVRHEIRNVLNSIRSPAEIVRNNFQKGDPLKMLRNPAEIVNEMEVIIQRVMKLNNMIEDELSFFQESNLSLQMLDIHDVIQASLSITKQEIDDNQIQLEFKGDLSLPKFLIDEDKMRIVFINLIRNACQAMTDGGTLTIKVKYHPKTSPKSRGYRKLFFRGKRKHSKSEAIIEIHDTGFGITPEAQKKIFEPFHTTKARGLGLGLVTVKNIVARHNGNIDVESKPGEGTKFTISLPVDQS